jgi:hypothetical protein
MAGFIIKKLPYDLTTNTGWAIVGQYMKRLGLSARVDRQFPVGTGGIASSCILKSYLALLSAKYAAGPVDFGALPCGYMAVDWDTFVMNNSGTQKEAVGRTYQGVDGYTPRATYLGSLGYCLELVLPMAAKLTPLPLLFRADSGLCSLKIMQEVSNQAAAKSREIAFIIK